MDQSLVLNVIRRLSDGNDRKGDVKSQCGFGCARRARGFGLRRGVAPRRRSAAQGEGEDTALRRRDAGTGRLERGRFGVRNVNGAATVFGVLGRTVDARCRAVWLHVELPIHPNGATGWVRAADVQQLPVRTRITIDLSERRVRFYKHGKLVLSSLAAIGSSATPTPLGRYYVNQRLIPEDPSGPFGPGA